MSKVRPGSAPHPPTPATVLIGVVGMSPAVLTETVWALARETPPVVPARVVPVTTIAGRQAIERELLTPPGPDLPTVWQAVRQAILGPGAVGEDALILEPARVIQAPNPRTGRADWLDDLRTPREHEAAADFLLGEMRRWTETPETRLVFSIAGGRKTMGALLYACASLLGRETDRVTHVLVNEPYDSPRLRPRFYFPAQPAQALVDGDGAVAIASAARVELADIPFVPLRNLFGRQLVPPAVSFSELVRRCHTEVVAAARKDLRLVVWQSRLQIAVDGRTLDTTVREHGLLLFLAQRAVAGEPALPSYAAGFHDFSAWCGRTHAARASEDFSDWRHEAKCPVRDLGEMERLVTRVRNQLKGKLARVGPPGALLLAALPRAGRFSLDLPADAIEIRN